VKNQHFFLKVNFYQIPANYLAGNFSELYAPVLQRETTHENSTFELASPSVRLTDCLQFPLCGKWLHFRKNCTSSVFFLKLRSLQVLPWNLRQFISYFFALIIYSINLLKFSFLKLLLKKSFYLFNIFFSGFVTFLYK
jgi:hypothetical protein